MASASANTDTHAPCCIKASATATCLGSSLVSNRTRTFLSTARMASPDVPQDALLQFAQPSWCGVRVPEELPVNLYGTVPPRSPDHHRVPLFVPFQDRTRPDTEFPANLGGHRYLTLRRHPRSCDWHN